MQTCCINNLYLQSSRTLTFQTQDTDKILGNNSSESATLIFGIQQVSVTCIIVKARKENNCYLSSKNYQNCHDFSYEIATSWH